MYKNDPLTQKGDELSVILRRQRDLLVAADTAVYYDTALAAAKLREAQVENAKAREIMDWLFRRQVFGGQPSAPLAVQGYCRQPPAAVEQLHFGCTGGVNDAEAQRKQVQ